MPPEATSLISAGTIPASVVAFFYGLSWFMSHRHRGGDVEPADVANVNTRREYRVLVQTYQVLVGIVDRTGVTLTDDERAVMREAHDTLIR